MPLCPRLAARRGPCTARPPFSKRIRLHGLQSAAASDAETSSSCRLFAPPACSPHRDRRPVIAPALWLVPRAHPTVNRGYALQHKVLIGALPRERSDPDCAHACWLPEVQPHGWKARRDLPATRCRRERKLAMRPRGPLTPPGDGDRADRRFQGFACHSRPCRYAFAHSSRGLPSQPHIHVKVKLANRAATPAYVQATRATTRCLWRGLSHADRAALLCRSPGSDGLRANFPIVVAA